MKKLLILVIGIFLTINLNAQKLVPNTYLTVNVKLTHADPLFFSGPGSGVVGIQYSNPYPSETSFVPLGWGLNYNVVTINTKYAGLANFNYHPDNERIWGCCDDTPYCWRFLFSEPDRHQTIYFSQGQTGTITVEFVLTPTHFIQNQPGALGL